MIKKLLIAFLFGIFFNSCTKNSPEEELAIGKAQEIERAFQSQEINNDFLQENLQIFWQTEYYDQSNNSYIFSTSLSKQLSKKNSTLTYNYELNAKLISDKWVFELRKLLTTEKLNLSQVSSTNLENFTGSIYNFKLNGKLKKIQFFKNGDLIQEFSGKVFKNTSPFKYESPRWDEPNGCLTPITTEVWQDNFSYASVGGVITDFNYDGSRLMYTRTEYINTCEGYDPDDYSPGGYRNYHDHYNSPHGPNASSTYTHPDDRVLENDPPEEALKVDRSEAFLNNRKINCTYEQLLKETSIHKILINFFGTNAVYDVSFDIVENLVCNGNANASGCTTPLVNNAYKIDIDKEYLLSDDTPTIFLAQTLIHEAIHANLYSEVKRMTGNEPVDKDFANLYEKYRQEGGWSHQVMADKYIDLMVTSLKEIHPRLNDQQFINYEENNTLWDWDKFYEAVAYRGLQNTVNGGNYHSVNANDIAMYYNEAETFSTKTPNCDE